MNFFEEQRRARARTKILVLIFILALFFLVIATYAVIHLGYALIFLYFVRPDEPNAVLTTFHPTLFWASVLGVSLVLALASGHRIWSLRNGAVDLAFQLGGKRINRATTNPIERRLLNITQEMAVASGITTPEIFVLDQEDSINAFAAGNSPNDSVVAVSSGALKYLNRDELQGVIAHEFSHILNGDCKINLRLIGILYGITIIGATGKRLAWPGQFRRKPKPESIGLFSMLRRRRRGEENMPLFILIGVLLQAIGCLGVLTARLLKAAISREREFLADASAIQFTRNSIGVSGALKKIASLESGSLMRSPYAEEASHLYFSDAIGRSWFGLMDSHPNIFSRILAVEPTFKGDLPRITLQADPDQVRNLFSADQDIEAAAKTIAPQQQKVVNTNVEKMLDNMGVITQEHLVQAKAIIDTIPQAIILQSLDSYGTQAILFGLVLSPGQQRINQIDILKNSTDAAMADEISKLLPELRRLGPVHRLALVDMLIPSIRSLTKQRYLHFRACLEKLAHQCDQNQVFEYVLFVLITKHCDPHFFGPVKRMKLAYEEQRALSAASDLIATLGYFGNPDSLASTQAIRRGLEELELKSMPQLKPNKYNLETLERSLSVLFHSPYSLKEKVIRGCLKCILDDDTVTVEEYELMRAICEVLDLPMPLLLPEDSQ